MVRDATSGNPVAKVQVSLAGGDGQDDTKTDDDGRFDLHAATPARDHVVVFYGDDNVTRQLSATQCDEHVELRVGLSTSSPPMM